MKTNRQEFLETNVFSISITDIRKLKDPNLTPDLFELPVHREIMNVCKSVIANNANLTAVPYDEIIPRLPENLQNYFTETMGEEFAHADYDSYLSQLIELKAIRDIKEQCTRAETGEITLEELQAQISKMDAAGKESALRKWTLDELHTILKQSGETIVFKKDKYMQGVRPKKNTVNVIGARTGVGKTAYALNLVNDLAERYRVLYFNLEMNDVEVNRRLIALQSNVEIWKIENNKMTDEENTRFADACYRYANRLNIAIIDGSKSIDSIRRIVARESRKEHCIVFVDHIGYIKNRGFNNTRESVQYTMIELNNMTKDFDCTVFAVSQLNRGAEGEMPTLKDLKDSGEVEQTAHSITLLYDESNDRAIQVADYRLICAKNRGALGEKRARFDRNRQRFIYAQEKDNEPQKI